MLLMLSFMAAAEDDVITVRTIGFAPYGIDSGAEPSGIYYEAANQLLARAGYRSVNHITPYTRIINGLKSGYTDLTIMFKYPELTEHVIYVAALPPLQTVVVGLNGVSFESVASLRGKKLAYLRGANFHAEIDSDESISKHRTLDFLQGLKMLKVGRVDAIIGPMDPIISAASQMGEDASFLGEPLVLHENTPWVQVSKKSQHRLSIEKLYSIFQQFKAEGSLEALRRKYILLPALPEHTNP